MQENRHVEYKTPWIVNDNQKFIGAIYTTRRGNDVFINSKSKRDEIIGWVSLVTFDRWEIRLGEDNNRKLIDSRVNMLFKLHLNHLNIKPIINEILTELKKRIQESTNERGKLERGTPKDHWIELRIEEDVYYKQKLESLLNKIKAKKKDDREYITEEDIDRAREYPIDSIIDFSRAGYASCIFHSEDTASMYYYKKTNHCYCFGCNKAADAISVYRQVNGVSFVEAVKKLSGK